MSLNQMTHPNPVKPEDYDIEGKHVATWLINQKIHQYYELDGIDRPFWVSPDRLPTGHNY